MLVQSVSLFDLHVTRSAHVLIEKVKVANVKNMLHIIPLYVVAYSKVERNIKLLHTELCIVEFNISWTII